MAKQGQPAVSRSRFKVVVVVQDAAQISATSTMSGLLTFRPLHLSALTLTSRTPESAGGLMDVRNGPQDSFDGFPGSSDVCTNPDLEQGMVTILDSGVSCESREPTHIGWRWKSRYGQPLVKPACMRMMPTYG